MTITDGSAQPGEGKGADRIAVIDLARGLAVMGILVINVTTMAGPGLASDTPDWHGHASARDWASFAFTWLFFEGKMRAMFATLFGASMVLFLSRGNEGRRTLEQARRLLWLAIFGYVHFLLFWWGDILFTYAIAGAFALMFKDLPPEKLAALGIGGIVFVALFAALGTVPTLLYSQAVVAGIATDGQAQAVADFEIAQLSAAAAKMSEYAMRFGEAIRYRLTVMPAYPLRLAGLAVFEAFPLMLCGMALAKSGFFTGGWRRETLHRIAFAGIGVGLAWYGLMFAYEAWQDFSITATSLLPYRMGLIGRCAMAAGYFAVIVMVGPGWLRLALGRRVAAAGRMAFSNYLLSTVVMTFLFHGWGLGLAAQEYGHFALMGFVLLAWALMLGWSQPWLARFGIGPLEYVWRKLAGMGIRRAPAGIVNS